MATCEKCWWDAGGIASDYFRLLDERKDHPCTPEQQAGSEATECPVCKRITVHQHALVCVACGWRPKGELEHSAATEMKPAE